MENQNLEPGLEDLNVDNQGLRNVYNRMANRRESGDFSCLEFRRLTDKELSDLFRSSGIIQKIVKIYPQKAKSIGYILKDKNGNVVESNNVFLLKAIEEGSIYSRLYGRCLLYLKFDDMVPENKQVKPGSVLTGFEIKFDVYRDGDFYTFNTDKIHHSRVIEMIGINTYQKETFENDLNRHDSVIQRIYKSFTDFTDSTDDAKFILKNISYLAIGIDNLGAMSKSNEGQQMIFDRLTTLNINRSINRVLSYDKSKEAIDFISQTLNGVENILDRAKEILIAESDYPSEQLFEESSTQSLGSGIQNQLIARYLWAKRCRDWVIDNQQEYYFQFFSTVLPDFFDKYLFEVPFIVELTDTEKAEIEKMGAERNKILIEAGVLSPDECRTGYEGANYTLNISLDDNAPRKNVIDAPEPKEININPATPVTEDKENSDSIPDDLFWNTIATITLEDLNKVAEEVLTVS